MRQTILGSITTLIFASMTLGATAGPLQVTELNADSPADATATAAAPAVGCTIPGGCTVAGAEVDDAATIKARAKVGTGPAAGLASDRRVATDIKDLGTLPNGLKIYAFKYLWDDTVRVGVMAQDLQTRPDTKRAVLTLANGLLGVDYKSLGLRMATEKEWLQHGPTALKATYQPQATRAAKLDEPVHLFNKRAGY
jgi:hypothetical protein